MRQSQNPNSIAKVRSPRNFRGKNHLQCLFERPTASFCRRSSPPVYASGGHQHRSALVTSERIGALLRRRSPVLLYGAETVRQAEALLDRSERFFGLETLGTDMQGSAMHQTLLAAYDKLFAADR